MGGISGGPVHSRQGRPARRPALHGALGTFAALCRKHFHDLELTRSLFELDRDRITCSGGVAGDRHDGRAHHARSWL